jgi:hypothetical protein
MSQQKTSSLEAPARDEDADNVPHSSVVFSHSDVLEIMRGAELLRRKRRKSRPPKKIAMNARLRQLVHK